MFPVICRRKGSGERGVSGEVPGPERGPWGAWASGTLRDKETSFCRSPGLGTALGSECPAEPRPFSQSGASISKGGRSVGTRARCSQRKADSIRLFPVSFISARCQRPTSGWELPWATRQRTRRAWPACAGGHVLHRPAACVAVSFGQNRNGLQHITYAMDGSMGMYSGWSRRSYLTQAKTYKRETNKTHRITTKGPFRGMWTLEIEIEGEIHLG
jgi:hypothetical protein